MKPYLVHKTWIDLDHVLAIGATVNSSMVSIAGYFCSSHTCSYLIQHIPGSQGCALHDGSRYRCRNFADPEFIVESAAAQKVLDALILAWREKDTPAMQRSSHLAYLAGKQAEAELAQKLAR